ncbi:hypothetical protein [Pseudomonas entomophila]|uniref:hypothetical protein n=1 Tax=Pseudomonas entomophila TaxID=312306 RepID=UPI001EFF6F41|nr:hypothetical protein [Pseudomonas entomophila]MCG8292238.1 hypothetical protein [Pseudomonas entomophila]
MDYPKRIPNVGLVGGKFVDENVSTGLPGSLIPSAWGNAVTDELLAVIKAAGLTPSEDDNAQLLQAIQGVAASDVKRAVRVATTGPIALSGLQTIDGVALATGDRVLVKDQANASQNWIYNAAGGAWARALDASDNAECTPGHLIIVQAGTTYAGSMWQLTNTAPPQVGTTALTFAQLFGKTGVVAGSYRQVSVDAQGRVTGGSNPTTLGGYSISDAYTQAQTNNLLAEKAAKATTLGGYGITDAYTQTQMNGLLASKASTATTLAGYGITDGYAVTMLAGDYNALQKNGHYLLGSSTAANRPPNFNGSWAIRQLEAGYGGILAFDLATDVIAYRRTTPSEYGQWVKIFHTGNFNPDLKADKADVADPWALMPIGVPIPLFLHLHPDGTPPLNKSYRYISLTASDSYNGGVLTGESISGSAPLVSATAVVSLAGSPLNGKTVNLINTEQRLLRGTTVPGQLLQDAMQSISGSVSGLVSGVVSASGALSFTQSGTASTFDGANARGTLTFNAGSVARTADETRVKSIGVVYFMRIK